MFASTIAKKENLNDLVKSSFSLIVAMAGIVTVLCFFYRQEIMQLMYHAEPGENEADFLLRIGQYAKVFQFLWVVSSAFQRHTFSELC